MRRVAAGLLIAVLATFTAPGARAAEPAKAVPCAERAELAKRFGAIQTMRANYSESKRLLMLAEPLVTEGRMFYQQPDKIHQSLLKPTRQDVTIAGGKLKVVHHDLGHTETLDVSANPTAQSIVQSVLEVMSGKVTALQEKYSCQVSDVAGGYHLDLAPLQAPLNKIMKQIQVDLDRDLRVKQVTLTETGGDTSVLTFEDVVYDKPFSAAEQQRYFAP